MHRVFILSPAKTTGKRASLLFNENASFPLAKRLRTDDEISLGEVFSFLSGLYFRGKLAYATHFARPPEGVPATHVITSDSGLTSADTRASLELLSRFAATPIDPLEPRYREPLERTALELRQQLPKRSEVVLLGSIATGKYLNILQQSFGDRLVFPKDFIGRGDMSRGGLLLRCVQAGTELEYVSIGAAESRTGKRPPKLTPAPRLNRKPIDR